MNRPVVTDTFGSVDTVLKSGGQASIILDPKASPPPLPGELPVVGVLDGEVVADLTAAAAAGVPAAAADEKAAAKRTRRTTRKATKTEDGAGE